MKPRVLIVTEKVDKKHELFGFFHSRLIDFAKDCEKVIIVCLEEREHNLPPNVVIHSLGKETGRSRLKYIWRFYHYLWACRYDYDSVFVHLTPLYVILGAPLWRLFGKRIVLWYNHPFTDWQLRLAHVLAHRIITTSKHRLGINGSKVIEVEGAVDLEAFSAYLNI